MAVKPVTLVLFVLMFVTWVVMMAGIAAIHDDLEDKGATKVGKTLRPFWWGVWFEFFIIGLFIVCIVTGKIDEWATVLVVFCGMASAYLMNHVEALLQRDDNDGGGWDEDAVKVSIAGFIMVIMVNWMIILLYGNSNFRAMAGGMVKGFAGDHAAEPDSAPA